MTPDDILQHGSGRTITVTVCPDAGLLGDFTQANEELDQALRRTAGVLADDDETAELRARVDELKAQVEAALVELRLQEVPPTRRYELAPSYTLTGKAARERGARDGQIDAPRWYARLFAEAMGGQAAGWDEDAARRVLDISTSVEQPIVDALDRLHGQAEDPLAAIGRARS